VVAAAVGCLVLAPLAGATTYVVTKRTDPVPGVCTKSDCSLREAVRAANAHAGSDRVVLPSRLPYELSRPSTGEDGALDGDLDITNHGLVIVHSGKGRATIDANGIDRVFQVFAGAPTRLVKLKITGGNLGSSLNGSGGGILTFANLWVVDSIVTRNTATEPDGSGGGIYAFDGKLTILRSTVSHNRADTSGAIDVGNHGVTIKSSTIANNRADFAGVGYFYGDGNSRIERTTIAGNRSTGESGAIYYSESGGTITIVGSTISGNRAGTDGGGFSARNGTVHFVNTTIANNKAGASGGGIHALTPVTLNGVTIVRNVANLNDTGSDGGGLWKATSGFVVSVENSLIALNKLADGRRADCHAEVTSHGHNLISSTGPFNSCVGFDQAGDKVRSNPRLGQLKKNGGPTKTVALLKGSPALNGAKRSTAPKKDQRGVKRGKKPDIGAYERRVL
jgi:CSLREA domain-containing protein